MKSGFIASLITAINDMLKIEATLLINTGDRARDNAILAVVLLFMTYAVNFVLSKKLARLCLKFKLLFIRSISGGNCNTINKYYKGTSLDYTIEIHDNVMLYKVFKLYYLIYSASHTYILKSNSIKVRNNHTLTDCYIKNVTAELKKWYEFSAKDEKVLPIYKFVIYTDSKGYIFIRHSPNDVYGVILGATSVEVIKSFEKYLAEFDEKIQTVSNTLKIYNEVENCIYDATLFSSRNMDMYVSKHKPKIINMLDKFLSNTPTLGGYGSLNLGIMLYGEPGTGKTLLMKAVANYLNRSIKIINISKIKTCKQFMDLFKATNKNDEDYTKLVYVFDEFDCIKGVVSNRANKSDVDTADIKQSIEIKELNARRLQIMQIPVTEVNKEYINSELAKINDEVATLNNSLTLDTMLTVLDGVIEHSGRVIIAATNHIDLIDPALIRDGRFDIKLKLDKFDEEETRELLTVMFRNSNTKDLAKLSTAKLASSVYTPAKLVNMASGCANLAEMLGKVVIEEPKTAVNKKKKH